MATPCDKYQPRKCWKTGRLEGDVTCCGDCSRCTVGMEAVNIPTFGELSDAYLTFSDESGGKIRRSTARTRKSAISVLYKHSRIEPTDKITALDDEVWEEFLLSARATHAPASLKSIGSSLHALLADEARKYFKLKYGWDCPAFPDLPAEAKEKPWISLPPTQRRKIRDYQFDLFQLADPRKYLCVTAAWERGQRKCDALRNHWSTSFVELDGTVWWNYVSVKNGKESHWPVDPDTWRMLRTAKERLLKLRRHDLGNYPDSYLRIADAEPNRILASAIWNQCNDDLRDLMGWTGSKAMHNLRKDATDTVFQTLGIDEAMEFSTDNERTLRRHYIGKKHILPNIPSIAKM